MMTSDHRNQVRDFIQLLFDPGESFYTKTGQVSFQYNEVNEGGAFLLRQTHLSNDDGLVGQEHSETRHLEITAHDGIDYLTGRSLLNDGGVFFVGAINAEYPLKDYCRTTRDIVAEMDDGTTEEQWAKIRTQEQNTGLPFSVVSSGNKSLHVHLTTEPPLPYDRNIYYRRLMVLLFDSDPAVARHHQPVRLPGFFRKEKGNYQELLQLGERVDEETLRSGFKQAFEANNWTFPETIPDDWWVVLRTSHTLQADLAIGYDQWKEYKLQEEEERHKRWLEFKSSIDIEGEQDTRELILSALDAIPPRIPGAGTYEDYRRLACAVKNELGESEAISLMERHSPSASCGWNVEQVIRSSTGKYNAGTIFNFAKEFGWSFPKRTRSYDTDYYDGDKVVLSGDEAMALAKENLEERQFSAFQEELIRKYNEISHKWQRGFKYDNLDDLPQPTTLTPNTINYYPELVLPSPSDYEGEEPPKFILPPKYKQYRAKLWTQLIAKGWDVHDRSFVGSGKTQEVTKLGKYLYIDVNYKNPSVAAIEDDTVMMPPRSEYGLYRHEGRLHNDPPPEIREAARRVKNPNCRFAQTFNALNSKGYDVMSTADGHNPVCAKCPNNRFIGEGKTICSSVPGMFKHDRKEAIAKMSQSNGRCHVSQLQPELFVDEEGSTGALSNLLLVWEEAGTIQPFNSLVVSELDITRAIASITQMSSDVGAVITIEQRVELIGILTKIHNLYDFKAAKAKAGSNKFYGISPEVLREHLGEPPSWLRTSKDLVLANFKPDWEQLIPDYQHFDVVGHKDKQVQDQLKMINRRLKDEHRSLAKENIAELPSNWLEHFLNVWHQDVRGTLSFNDSNKLTITTYDDTHAAVASLGKGNIFLDATARTEDLIKLYQLDSAKTIVVEEETPRLDNLMVLNINFPGIKSLDWSDSALLRLGILRQTLLLCFGEKNTAFIVPKRYKEELSTSYYYGRDDRGSNDLKDYRTLVFIGTPWANVGDAKIQYSLITGGLDGFEGWYHHKLYEQRVQAFGRSRCQWTREVKTQIFVGVDQNFDFLKEWGAEVHNLDITEVCPEAASKPAILKRKILEQASALVRAGKKLTQEAIAIALEITQGWVSRLFGGSNKLTWIDFKKLLLSLYEHYKEKVIFLDGAKDQLAEWLETAQPIDLTKFISCYRRYGVEGFLEMLDIIGASLGSALQLLWQMTPFFDERTNKLNRVRQNR